MDTNQLTVLLAGLWAYQAGEDVTQPEAAEIHLERARAFVKHAADSIPVIEQRESAKAAELKP